MSKIFIDAIGVVKYFRSVAKELGAIRRLTDPMLFFAHKKNLPGKPGRLNIIAPLTPLLGTGV